MNALCEPIRLRVVSLFFLSPSSETRETRKWHARDGRGARAWTAFTKSEEKQRLLAVYEQIFEGLNVVNSQPLNDLNFHLITVNRQKLPPL